MFKDSTYTDKELSEFVDSIKEKGLYTDQSDEDIAILYELSINFKETILSYILEATASIMDGINTKDKDDVVFALNKIDSRITMVVGPRAVMTKKDIKDLANEVKDQPIASVPEIVCNKYASMINIEDLF